MSQLEALTLKDRPLPKIRVSSIVIFSILNSFSRRSSRESRVIGTLLGEFDKDGIIVTDCFAVPFSEKTDELYVEINQEYHKKMYGFHRRNNKKEVIVGWYSTTTSQGQLLIDNSSLIHDFYASECASEEGPWRQEPIHLVVDSTLLLGDTLQARAFVSKQLIIGDQTLARAFREVKVQINLTENEVSCLYLLKEGGKHKGENPVTEIITNLPSSQGRVEHSLKKLISVLDTLQEYVDQVVVAGGVASSKQREVGVQLAEALQAITLTQPQSETETGSSGIVASNVSAAISHLQALQTRYQDLVMLAYLSSLTQTQAVISEKINQLL